MRSIIATILILSICLCFSCSDSGARQELTRDAAQIDSLLSNFATDMLGYRDIFQRGVADPSLYPDHKYPETRYKLHMDIMLYHDQEAGLTSILATGMVKVGSSQMERMRVIENLEGNMKKIADAYPDFILSVFMFFTDGVAAYYPAFNPISFLPPGFNFLTFAPDTFKRLEIAENPSRTYIYGPPYIDVGGNGYLFTVRIPIDARDAWVGYLGVDLDIGYIKKYFIEKEGRLEKKGRRLLIITPQGILLASNEAASRLLGVGELNNFLYLKQVPNAQIPPEFDLLSNEKPELVEFAKRALEKKDFDFEWNGDKYSVWIQEIAMTGWLLAELR